MLTRILCVIAMMISSFLIKDQVFDSFSRVFFGKSKGKAKVEQKLALPVGVAEKGTIFGYLSVCGTIHPEDSIVLRSSDPSGSKIKSIRQERECKKGDELVVFEHEASQASRDRYHAVYMKEKAKLERLEERKKKGGNVSEAEMSDARLDVKAAEAEYRRASAEHEKNHHIIAPFDGAIGIPKSREEYVRPGEEIAKYASLSMVVDFSVAQSDLKNVYNSLRIGSKVKVILDSGAIVDAEVINFDPVLDKSFCLKVRARPIFANKTQESDFMGNFHVSVKIPVHVPYSKQESSYIVNQSAICLYNDNDLSRGDERAYILVLDEDNRVKRAYVTLGSRKGNKIQINFTDRAVIEPLIKAGKPILYLTDGDVNSVDRLIEPLKYAEESEEIK